MDLDKTVLILLEFLKTMCDQDMLGMQHVWINMD